MAPNAFPIEIKTFKFVAILLTIFCFCVPAGFVAAAEHPGIRDLNTPREFPAIDSKEQWETRAANIREHVLVCCGLWPMPEKTPLKANIFDKIERPDYSVEKVYIQTMPGFYLAGNLYRPLGRGKGPFPGVLNPHGHWKDGRLTDTKDGSIPARCINFARQGMVAFSYDMVGFNDTHFVNIQTNKPYYDTHRTFGAAPTDQLWMISLMGFQTWNSIRALDFLESLPDVDKKRLACTGESGGGTQTFMLGAVDDRLAIQAPVVMVSHTMQGGCSCENAPGLRLEYSNMEIAAVPAPRPQILVAATGDWTKATMTVEGPAIGHVYDLFKATNQFNFVRFDFGHNYNQTSREAVYAWFGKWLIPDADPLSLKEKSCQKEEDADLRVFPDGNLPADALTREQFTESLKKLHQKQFQSLLSAKDPGLEGYRQKLLPAWRHSLQVDWPVPWPKVVELGRAPSGGFSKVQLAISHPGEESRILVNHWTPRTQLTNLHPKLVVLARPDEALPAGGEDEGPQGLTRALLEHRIAVMEIAGYASTPTADQFANFYSTYNRTKLQQRVRDLLATCSVANSMHFEVVLVGTGAAGLWSLLAAPGAHAVVADANETKVSDDQALLTPDLFSPGLRTLGSFQGPALLGAPHPLLLHHTGADFPTGDIRYGYKALGADRHLAIHRGAFANEQIVSWVAKL